MSRNESTLSQSEPAGGHVHYEVDTSTGNIGVVVYEVHEVYVYIPTELSAAGVELKFGGTVRIIDKEKEFFLKWTPCDLSHEDVASFYSSQVDGWAMVDEIVEPPEIIDPHELKYPGRSYHLKDFNMSEGSATSPDIQATASKSETSNQGIQYLCDGEARVTGIVSTVTPSRLTSKEISRTDSVNFPISKLHSVKELHYIKKSLTFFLTDGRELPTLHFHDGGTAGLLQALQRYTYLVRDPSFPSLYRTTTFDKSVRVNKSSFNEKQGTTPPPAKGRTSKGIDTKPVENLLQGAVSGFVGISRAVRQHLLPEKLLDVRPGTENDDFEETLQTVVMGDIRGGSPTSPSSQVVSPKAKTGTARHPECEPDPELSLFTDFQIITDIRGKLPMLSKVYPRQPPVSLSEWETLRDDNGRISSENETRFRARVMYGGIDAKLRKEVWKYLLGYMVFDMTDIERMEQRDKKEKAYWTMKAQWLAFTEDQEKRFSKWREVKQLINKDVLRTDRDLAMYNDVSSVKLTQLEHILRTYVMYNFDLGYVQGMSDLLAPLLVILDNEVDTFWCFAGFMEMVKHHFELSQSGMRTRLKQLRALLNITDPDFYQFLKDKESNNLYFCFRWLLVNFKREFSYEDICKIWEVIWTNYLSQDYSLFIALAILQREKQQLEKDRFDFSDILQHINSLSKQLPVDPLLESAEALCRQLGSCKTLPEDLQTLVVRPLPGRPVPGSEAIAEQDTIVCHPEMRAVPAQKSS